MKMASSGHVFWIFGLSGAGKSTVAHLAAQQLQETAIPILILDGDAFRSKLGRDLGFSCADRTENIRRAAEVACLALESGISVFASFITPLNIHRALVRNIIGLANMSLVFADAPLSICRRRDVKGLYARADAGELPEMTGVNSTFEMPIAVDLTLPTSAVLPSYSAKMLADFALSKIARGYFHPFEEKQIS